MKQKNIPLILGSLILIVLLLIVLFPEVITHKSPYTIAQLRFSTEEGKLNAEKAPFKPSKDYILGSDDLGRDIWSYIVYGTRLTLLLGLLIAFVQFMIAIPLALLGGSGHSTIKSITNQTNLIFSGIPALLICILILQIDFFVSLNKSQSIVAFVCVLSMVGWPKLGSLLTERVESINQQAFILGEIALGKKKLPIATQNIIPHLAPEIIVLFFMEVARNLSLIMQLGIFGVFIGNLKVIMDSDRGQMTYYSISYEPEWASMLSTSRTYLTLAPWTVIFPALAFFVTVLGFNLFGEGLRNQLQLKDSKLVPTVRRFLSFDITYFYQELRLKPNRHLKKIIGIIVLGTLLLVIVALPKYQFSLDDWKDITQTSVMIGTNESTEMANYIADTMKSLNIEPVVDDKYIVDYNIGNAYRIIEQSMEIWSSQESLELSEELKPNVDFTFVTTGDTKVSGELLDMSQEDLYSYQGFERLEDQIVLLDTSYYTQSFIRYFLDRLESSSKIKGVLLIGLKEDSLQNYITDKSVSFGIVKISKRVGTSLQTLKNPWVTWDVATVKLDDVGKNIVGLYKGSDKALEDELIAIGLSYNYADAEGIDVLKFNLELMKQLCALKGNKRSILFFFFDGTVSDAYHGVHPLAEKFPLSPQKVKAYIDITGITQSSFDSLDYSARQAPITRQFAWSLGQSLSDTFKREHVTTYELLSEKNGNEFMFTQKSSNNAMYWDAGIATLIVASHALNEDTTNAGNTTNTGNFGKTHALNELGTIILEVINKNNY